MLPDWLLGVYSIYGQSEARTTLPDSRAPAFRLTYTIYTICSKNRTQAMFCQTDNSISIVYIDKVGLTRCCQTDVTVIHVFIDKVRSKPCCQIRYIRSVSKVGPLQRCQTHFTVHIVVFTDKLRLEQCCQIHNIYALCQKRCFCNVARRITRYISYLQTKWGLRNVARPSTRCISCLRDK